MTSPYSTGGGGTHLEARVTASCLAAILCEASVRGLPGERATQLRTQRASFGDLLDDVIVDGIGSDGRNTQLHLQVKSKLTFTEKDAEWVETLQRAWDSFSKPGFDQAVHRLGVAIGTYNARVDQHYQSVFAWAEHSASADNFFERITQGDYSHKDKQSFVATVRTTLETCAARTLVDDEVWRFLKAFVIVHYDFQSEASSRDAAFVVERLKSVLVPEHRDQASRIWDHLVAKAGELIPAGGGATRATLVEQLAGFDIGATPSFRKDIQILQRQSQRALDDIKSHIQCLKLHRAEAYQAVRDALSDGRFIQIDGEPGTGKSALLKEIAEECARNGPVFVLKDSRIHPKGWAAHAHVLGVSDDLAALLREFACAGEAILFIDGIDKITEPAVHLTVNDILKTIADDERLASWRVLVTIREQNLKHLETWLDPDALKKLPLRTIAVTPLDDDELNVVANTFPRLRPLLFQSGGADIILKRPFFLNALLGLAGDGEAQLPATEAELLRLWWQMGGSDRKDSSSVQHRRNLLLDVGEALCRAPNTPVAIRALSPDVLEELKSAGVLRDRELGHSVAFAHDIFEEWTLCEYLIGQQANISELLETTGEPDILIRPVQLLGSYALEMSPSVDAWKSLLEKTGTAALRPVWQRTVLTSCLQSTRTTQLLGKLSEFLSENGGERLKKLLLALATLEVLPNPLFLNEKLTPDLPPEDRAKFAYYTAVPKPLTWVRFLDWLMPQMDALPPKLIPYMLPIFTTWQKSYAGRKVRHCPEIGKISYAWLKEIEDAAHPGNWNKRRSPFDGALSGRDAEEPIRALFLSSAGDVPALASEYLRHRASDRKHVHMFRDEILKNCATLARHLPSEFVDFFLAVFLEDEERDPFGSYSSQVMENLGIAGRYEFYPASPIQLPFLLLLRTHEDQALRLIRGLCNHSISVWRNAKQRGRHYSQPLTPIPITLTFPWGTQTFWGDGQVYLWFRAMWGNNAVESALMALEQWSLEQLEAGAAFEDIFRKAVEGNESAAALGIGVSLCLAHAGKGLECALPLISCPYLWEWDIPRFVQDSTTLPANEIGNWFKDRTQLSAVRALNQKPHRKLDIRHLIPYFVFSGDEALSEKFTASIRSFPDRLPLSYEEEKANPDHLAAMREKMGMFAEQADPQYWKTGPSQDGKHIKLWNEPPTLQNEKYKAQRERHAQMNEFMAVALWAQKSLESGTVNQQFSLGDAVAKARGWDNPDLFDTRSESFEECHRAAAVAGAAYVAAKNADAELWTKELATWCADVMERAATAPEPFENILVRSALLSMNPAVFSAHGFSALLARGHEIERCQWALLNLATNSLRAVQNAVFAAAKQYATTLPEFYWILFDLVLRQCVVSRDAIPDFHSIAWGPRETEHKTGLLERAGSLLGSEEVTALPTIPMPWIKTGKKVPRALKDTKGYERNATVFLYDIAEQILPRLCLEPLLSTPKRRAHFLKLVEELLEFTFQEIVPPFISEKPDYTGHTPFEWVFAFSDWCGTLCAHLTRDEAKKIILSRIWARDSKTALLILQGLVRRFMIDALLKPGDIPDEHVALWLDMTDWLFESPEWVHNARGDHLDSKFVSCALTTFMCAAPDFSGVICGIDEGWPHLQKFLPVIKRAICEFGVNVTLYLGVTTFLKRGGKDLLPHPALAWLHGIVVSRKGDQKFWQANGETTVELLKQLISEKSGALTHEHRRVITLIADILIDNGVRGAGFLQQDLIRAG